MRSVSCRSITLAVISAMVGAILVMGWPVTGSGTSGALANTSVPRVVRGHVLAFKVVEHTRLYDVVSGHGHRFRIRRGVRKATVRDLERCTVVRRTERVVVLRSPVLGPLNLNNAHDLVYENVHFQGRGSGYGDTSGLIFISGASHNITFRNCVFETNGYSQGNGVTIFDGGNGIHDITFDRCHFDYQPRMGFECVSRRSGRGAGDWPGYLRVNVTNCTFDVTGAEAISYDDDDPGHVYNGSPQGAGYCTVSGNVVLGVDGSYGNWSRTFEINRTRNMSVTGNWFGPGKTGIANFRQSAGDPTPANWVFSGNTWAGNAFIGGITYSPSHMWLLSGVQGITVADTMLVASPYYTTQWAWLHGIDRTVDSLDFGGSTIHGSTNAYGQEGTVTNIRMPTAQ